LNTREQFQCVFERFYMKKGIAGLMALCICCLTVLSACSQTKNISKATITTTTSVSTTDKIVNSASDESFDTYLINTIKKDDWLSLFKQKSEINLEDLINQGKIKVVFKDIDFGEGDLTIQELLPNVQHAYLLDINNDKINELWLSEIEGSGGYCHTLLFKDENGVFVSKSEKDGRTLPISYHNQIHFVGFQMDSSTKNFNAFTEFKLNDFSLIPVKTYDIKYTYSVSKAPALLQKVFNEKFYNHIVNYTLADSNIAVYKKTNDSNFTISVADAKNNHTFNFKANIFLSSDMYPSEWTLKCGDNLTKGFKGIKQIIGDDSETGGIYGFQFYRDKTGVLYYLKVLDTTSSEKLDYLVLKLYRFDKNDIVKVLEYNVHPTQEVKMRNKPADLDTYNYN